MVSVLIIRQSLHFVSSALYKPVWKRLLRWIKWKLDFRINGCHFCVLAIVQRCQIVCLQVHLSKPWCCNQIPTRIAGLIANRICLSHQSGRMCASMSAAIVNFNVRSCHHLLILSQNFTLSIICYFSVITPFRSFFSVLIHQFSSLLKRGSQSWKRQASHLKRSLYR